MRLPLLTGLALLLASAAALSGAALSRAGHEPPRLGLTPIGHEGTFFELTLAPGETRQLEVELANFGHDATDARTYAADAYSIVNGGFGAELFGDEPSGTTLWLDYQDQELRLGAGDAIEIAFQVTVPDGTMPGDYLTSLVVENAEPYAGATAGDIRFQQTTRSAIAVAIDVPGPREPALEIGGVGHHLAADASVVTFEIRNAGNEHLTDLTGTFVLRAADGTQIAAAPVEMDTVYAGMTTTLEAPLAARLAPAEYCAQLALLDAPTRAGAESACLPFAVIATIAPGGPTDGGPFRGIPVLQAGVDAAVENPLVAALAALVGAALVLAAIAFFARRRRGRAVGTRDNAPRT